MKKFVLPFLLMVFSLQLIAQEYHLQSQNQKENFSFYLNTGVKGKGAFVQYEEHKEKIALQLVSYKVLHSNIDDHPVEATYVWNEIINGKINGQYGITKDPYFIYKCWYKRNTDGKKFELMQIPEKSTNLSDDYRLLLHDVFISYDRYEEDYVNFYYTTGLGQTANLETNDKVERLGRTAHVEDYNFDGYDDVAFSIPDAGMGVYHTYEIFIYNTATKKFVKLAEPDYSNSKCSALCDVEVNTKTKTLSSSCRGGARWWKDIYQYKKGKLVWVKSSEVKE